MVDTLGSSEQRHVLERLAEMIMYLEIIKGLLRSAEMDAADNE